MTTKRKKLSLCGPVNESKRTCQRLRQVLLASFAHVCGSAPMMSAAHLPLTTELSLAVWEWKRNALAWPWWRAPAVGWVGLDTGMHCMLCMHPLQPMTKDKNYRTKVKGYKHASSPVNAAAYPAYPLNPPLGRPERFYPWCFFFFRHEISELPRPFAINVAT